MIIPYMGIITQGKSLWNALFTRTQRQLLALFFGHPERSYYANEVVRIAGVGTGSVQRQLARLVGAGLLTVRRVGNQTHYQTNRASPIFPELRSIVLKTFGIVEQLRAALRNLPGSLELAVVLVEPPDREDTSIELLLVTDDLGYADIVSGLTRVENRIGRTLRPQVFTATEFRALRRDGNAVLAEMLARPMVVLQGALDDWAGEA